MTPPRGTVLDAPVKEEQGAALWSEAQGHVSAQPVIEPRAHIERASLWPSGAAPLQIAAPTFDWRPWHGWAFSAVLAAAAYAVQFLPFPPFRIVLEGGVVRHPVGPAIIAIVLGVAMCNLLRLPDAVRAGSRILVKRSIPWAIVCIGAGLNLAVVATIGLSSLLIVVGSIAIAITVALLCGRALRLRGRTALLLSAGTAICGNSAILAVAPVAKAKEKEILVSIGVVNLLGLLFMLLLPVLGAMLAMSPEAFGVWAGASVHAVPQAIAAGFAYPGAGGAGEVATLVKLVRVAMLVPLVIGIALIAANGNGNGGLRSVKLRTLVPWFIWGFLAMAYINTLVTGSEYLPETFAGAARSAMDGFNWIGGILLTVCLAAIGLDVDLRKLARVGKRALLTGIVASVAMASGALVLITILL